MLDFEIKNMYAVLLVKYPTQASSGVLVKIKVAEWEDENEIIIEWQIKRIKDNWINQYETFVSFERFTIFTTNVTQNKDYDQYHMKFQVLNFLIIKGFMLLFSSFGDPQRETNIIKKV